MSQRLEETLLNTATPASLKAYQRGGALHYPQPIKEIILFQEGSVNANVTKYWNLLEDTIPISLWIGYPSSPSGTVTISVLDSTKSQVFWAITLNTNQNNVGNNFYYQFPFLVVEGGNIGAISCTSPVSSISIFSEASHIIKKVNPLS